MEKETEQEKEKETPQAKEARLWAEFKAQLNDRQQVALQIAERMQFDVERCSGFQAFKAAV